MSALRRFSEPFARFLALVLVVHVLLISAASASPALHQWLHADASRMDHECAITLFTHGASDDVPVVVSAAPEMVLLQDEGLGEPVRFAPLRYFSGILEHAPPRRA